MEPSALVYDTAAAAEAERAAARGKSLAALLENSLTTANNLLKW